MAGADNLNQETAVRPGSALPGKVAIVTGAGGGLGRAIALRFAEEGAEIVACDINEAAARETADLAGKSGRRCIAYKADLRDCSQIAAMVVCVLEEFGRIDVLVNNAGITRTTSLFDLEPAEWDDINSINSRGAFFCLQQVARAMVERRSGCIINIASIAGKGYAGTANIAYAASKGAMLAMTQIAAHALASSNVTCNAICPGPTVTDMLLEIHQKRSVLSSLTPEEVAAKLAKTIPLGRPNDPADIAGLAVFLASAAARNITGQSINIDGGLLMH